MPSAQNAGLWRNTWRAGVPALAQRLARRTGLPMNRLVEQALERLDSELRPGAKAQPLDAVWTLPTEGRRGAKPGATSAHDDLYDELGLPK
jgi:antitoxin VapB